MKRVEQTYVQVTPTVQAAAYAAGDLIGGKMTFLNALSQDCYTAELRGVLVIDKAVQDKDYNLVIFGDDPTGTTFTENAAFDIADTDLSKILTVVNVATLTAFADNGLSQVTEIARPLMSLASTRSRNLYGALVSVADPTFASTSDLIIRLYLIQD